jgi:hypothetical protein
MLACLVEYIGIIAVLLQYLKLGVGGRVLDDWTGNEIKLL